MRCLHSIPFTCARQADHRHQKTQGTRLGFAEYGFEAKGVSRRGLGACARKPAALQFLSLVWGVSLLKASLRQAGLLIQGMGKLDCC